MDYKTLSQLGVPNPSLVSELNSLLAEEFQAWYQYFIVKDFLFGKERPSVEKFFTEAADDELNDHAVKLLNRLSELGMPCVLYTPDTWKEQAKAKFETAPSDVPSQLDINIYAEQQAISHYKSVITMAEEQCDYTTAEMLKEILADEENHLSQLQDFKNDIVL